MKSGRLVVVSNRVSLPSQQRPGGLAIALLAALKEEEGLWFGWSGRSVAGKSGHLERSRDGHISYCTMDLSRKDVEDYYRDFSNRSLWPLLHSRVDLIDYSREASEGYWRVNRLFATTLARQLRADDVVWIHDYHLIPLAQALRELGVENRIGFFLHVPMPPAGLIATLPRHQSLFTALSAYDLIGFQTQADLEHYQDYLRAHAGGRPVAGDKWKIEGDRTFQLCAFPISIDTHGIAEQAADAVSKAPVKRLRASLGGRQLAIGVDRLDYSKGLPQRLRSFERYLKSHPHPDGRLTYLQIAPLSRNDVPEYRLLRQELEGLAGHINGLHSRPDWTPMRYVNRDFSHAVLTGFYRAADVALVTPLRDGMNLVAKEYVASQDPEEPGVLILSQFTGAVCELAEALIVNPYDPDEIADSIALAIDMPLKERRERWHGMMEILKRSDITVWRQNFLEALQTTQRSTARLANGATTKAA